MLLRVLGTALTGMRRHALLSSTVVLIVLLLTIVFNVVLLTSFAARSAVMSVGNQLDLAIQFAEEVDTFRADIIMRELTEQFPSIREIGFVSSDQVFDRLLTELADDSRTLASWLDTHTSTSPLPATLVVSVAPVLQQPILDWLSASRHATILDIPEEDSSSLSTTATTQVIRFDQLARSASFAAGIGFTVLATVVITFLLRLTIFSRKAELEISELVGATRSYVRLPFIFEGIFCAVPAVLGGALVSWLLAVQLTNLTPVAGSVGIELAQKAAAGYLGSFGLILGWQLLAAVIIGWVAAVVATARR